MILFMNSYLLMKIPSDPKATDNAEKIPPILDNKSIELNRFL